MSPFCVSIQQYANEMLCHLIASIIISQMIFVLKPLLLTVELIAFNQSVSELIMETENVTSLVIKQIACCLNVSDRNAYFTHFTSMCISVGRA